MTKTIIAIVLGLLLITAAVPAQGSPVSSTAVTNLMNIETPDCRRLRNSELACLACNIYFEARGEPVRGQLAVAKITLNRASLTNNKRSVCRVVWEKHQFTWTSRRKLKVYEDEAWAKSVDLAALMLRDGDLINVVPVKEGKLLYYHDKALKPKWAKEMTRVAVIGSHAIYAATEGEEE